MIFFTIFLAVLGFFAALAFLRFLPAIIALAFASIPVLIALVIIWWIAANQALEHDKKFMAAQRQAAQEHYNSSEEVAERAKQATETPTQTLDRWQRERHEAAMRGDFNYPH